MLDWGAGVTLGFQDFAVDAWQFRYYFTAFLLQFLQFKTQRILKAVPALTVAYLLRPILLSLLPQLLVVHMIVRQKGERSIAGMGSYRRMEIAGTDSLLLREWNGRGILTKESAEHWLEIKLYYTSSADKNC
jgi:hypothetical protein